MSIRKALVVGLLWVGSLVGVGLLAQGRQDIISGNDVGFRPDSVQRAANRVTGTLMVRVNGQWTEAQFSMRVAPATQ